MKELKRIFSKINKRDFSLYLFFSILLLITLVAIGGLNFTQARYETNAEIDVEPTLAFFIVDVSTTSGHIKLDGIIPSATKYPFSFQVSNFTATEHADVDLTYTIEIVTTTNMPLEFKIFKGNDQVTDQIDLDSISSDANGVFYRHLVINDVSTMSFNSDVTDTYILEVEYPLEGIYYPVYYPESYAGIIDLIDIVIRAEQVV